MRSARPGSRPAGRSSTGTTRRRFGVCVAGGASAGGHLRGGRKPAGRPRGSRKPPPVVPAWKGPLRHRVAVGLEALERAAERVARVLAVLGTNRVSAQRRVSNRSGAGYSDSPTASRACSKSGKARNPTILPPPLSRLVQNRSQPPRRCPGRCPPGDSERQPRRPSVHDLVDPRSRSHQRCPPSHARTPIRP